MLNPEMPIINTRIDMIAEWLYVIPTKGKVINNTINTPTIKIATNDSI